MRKRNLNSLLKTMGIEDSSSRLGKPTTLGKDACLLLSLPAGLREKIYTCVFATTYVRCCKHRRHDRNAILQTCTRIQVEASSVLCDRTPLRFVNSHRQVFSSILPPKSILDRFQNIHVIQINTNGLDPPFI